MILCVQDLDIENTWRLMLPYKIELTYPHALCHKKTKRISMYAQP